MAFDPNVNFDEPKSAQKDTSAQRFFGKLEKQLAEECREALKNPHKLDEMFQLRRHNRTMATSPEDADFITVTTAGGIPLTGAGVSMLAQKVEDLKAKENEKKSKERALKQSLDALNEQLAQIGKKINKLKDENERLQNDIDKNKKQIEELKQEVTEIQNLKERLENGEDPESVKQDPTYKKAAEEYRKKTGKDPDNANPMDILIWQENQKKAKVGGLETENKNKKSKIDDNEEKIKKYEQEYEEKINNSPSLSEEDKKILRDEMQQKMSPLKKENIQLDLESQRLKNATFVAERDPLQEVDVLADIDFEEMTFSDDPLPIPVKETSHASSMEGVKGLNAPDFAGHFKQVAVKLPSENLEQNIDGLKQGNDFKENTPT